MAAFAWRHRTSFGTPHQTFCGPIGISTEGLSGCVRMAAPHPCRHTPHEDRGPIGSSTEGPSGKVRMAAPPHFGTPLTRVVAPQRAPPKAPMPKSAWRRRINPAHTSHVSWPHREVHLTLQWQSSHGGAATFRLTPHALRGPRGNSPSFAPAVLRCSHRHMDGSFAKVIEGGSHAESGCRSAGCQAAASLNCARAEWMKAVAEEGEGQGVR